jgi:hypothetical protein
MALAVAYSDDGHGVIYTASGKIRGEELVDAQSDVESRFSGQIWYSLLDFDEVSEVDIATAHLKQLAEQAISSSKSGEPGRVVGIYAKDDLPFALSRMWMIYVEHGGWETCVFRERHEAIAWIRTRVAKKFSMAISLE